MSRRPGRWRQDNSRPSEAATVTPSFDQHPPDASDSGVDHAHVHVEGDVTGILSLGAGSTNVQQIHTVLPSEALRPADQVAAPGRLLNVPFHSPVFVGREKELTELREALAAPGGVVVAAVHGLGGVGKSTLAARYAMACPQRFNPVWWVTADSASAIEAGLASLAVGLQPELAQLPSEALAQRAITWLAAHDDWLLILDNVTDPADIAPLLGRTPAGRVLMTSRLAEGWHRLGAALVRVDVLSESQAVELLTRIAGYGRSGAALDDAALDDAVELVRELGCLPLAVEQAAAYLHQTRLNPREYLRLLASQPMAVLDQAARGADAERTIARIWRVTLDQLADDPLAGRLLRILAWYGAEAIPLTLLDSVAESSRLRQALGSLAAYSMIGLDSATVTVHRLVQAVARTPDPADPHRQEADIAAALEQATLLLESAAPTDVLEPASWPDWRSLEPHIAALAGHAPPETGTMAAAYLFNQTGLFVGEQGAPSRAIGYFLQAHGIYLRQCGDSHKATLAIRNNLGNAYLAVGAVGRAVPLLRQVLADRERLLGSDHPQTLGSRNDLAGALAGTGDLRQAITLYEKALTDFDRVLGPDHRDTLVLRGNLAHAYGMNGDLQRATDLYERVVASAERVQGADHPDTLTARSNLASIYVDTDDFESAIPLLERVLADSPGLLGSDHPLTLTARNNLASAYQKIGDQRAAGLCEQVLADAERVLGPDHPDTLTARSNVAYAFQAVDPQRAIGLYERVIADAERVLGPDHPDTLTARSNLAHACMQAGDRERATGLFEQVLAERERGYGPNHPDTLTARSELAFTCQATGELSRAIKLYEQAVSEASRAGYGDRPDMLTTRSNLVFTYCQAGDYQRAIKLGEQTVADAVRVVGPEHQLTLAAAGNLMEAVHRASQTGADPPSAT